MAAVLAHTPSGYVIQRPLKGSRISSFYPVKELPPLSALDSAFQLQEYISLLIRKDVHDVDTIVSIPGKGKERESGEDTGKESSGESQKEKDAAEAKDGEGKEVSVDEACWIYEQLRRLAQDLSHPLITMLQQECTRQTCPEMKAGEWLYLCVAHGSEGAMEQCCAIDYILHTLDSATALLNSPRAFPSRLSIPVPSHRHFSSLARRLGRIFAHAYFHHRAVFAQAEAESALYARFLALTSRFDLVPAEFLVIPPGIVGYGGDEPEGDGQDEYPRLLAASIEPHRENERGREDDGHARRGIFRLDVLGAPPLPVQSEGEPRAASPRKVGRSRTDTMVHSEVATVVEELGRAAAAAAAAGDGSIEKEANGPVEEEAPSIDNDRETEEARVEAKTVQSREEEPTQVAETSVPPVSEPETSAEEPQLNTLSHEEVVTSVFEDSAEPSPQHETTSTSDDVEEPAAENKVFASGEDDSGHVHISDDEVEHVLEQGESTESVAETEEAASAVETVQDHTHEEKVEECITPAAEPDASEDVHAEVPETQDTAAEEEQDTVEPELEEEHSQLEDKPEATSLPEGEIPEPSEDTQIATEPVEAEAGGDAVEAEVSAEPVAAIETSAAVEHESTEEGQPAPDAPPPGEITMEEE